MVPAGHVVALGRWMAADMYLREVDTLRFEVRGNTLFMCLAGFLRRCMLWKLARGSST